MKLSTTLVLLLLVPVFSASSQQQGDVQVLVSTPRGPTRTIDQSQTIVASFNQPMAPLRDVPADDDTGPMIIDPLVPGKYRWMGTSTLTFVPKTRLPYSSLFTVIIPAGTKSITGQMLRQEFRWQFETPRPVVLATDPYDRQPHVELDHSILLQFNQRIQPESASKFISIQEQSNQGVPYPPFSALIPPEQAANRENSVLLTIGQPLKKGATYTVRCKQGLIGVEGTLGMVSDFSFSFTTYGDLKFLGIQNLDRFSPSEYLRMKFTNPVAPKDVIQRLSFIPPLAIEGNDDNDAYSTTEPNLKLPFRAEQDYIGILSPGLKDRFGNVMSDTVRFRFRTGSYPPLVGMTTGQGVLEAYEAHNCPVTFVNVDSVLLQMGRVSPDKIVEVMLRLDYSTYQRLAWEQAILRWVDSKSEDTSRFSISRVWRPNIPRNVRMIRPVNLDDVLGKVSRGVVLLQVDNLFQDPNRRRYLKSLIQVTSLGITSKFSPDDNLFWVTNLKDASPVSNAQVEIRNDSNQVLWHGPTDAKGIARSPGWGKLGLRSNSSQDEEGWDYGSSQPRLWVIVKKDGDVAFTSSQWNEGIEPWTFGLSYEWNPKFESVEAEMFTDRGLYKAGERVDMKGIVRVRREGAWRIPKNLPLRLTVKDSRNEDVLTAEPRLSSFGSFIATVPLKPTAPLGYYSILVETKEMANGKERWIRVTSESFRVEAFRPAEFQTNVQIENKTCVIGDTVSGIVSARYLFGAVLKGAPTTWRVSTTPSGWAPNGFEGFYFGPLSWLSNYSGGGNKLLSSADAVLDNQGVLKVQTALRVGEIRGTNTLLLEADVTSPSRQVISGRSSLIIHGGEFYIGIAPSTTFTQTDSVFSYKLIAVTPEGTYVPRVSLWLKLVKRIWRSVRRAETGGRYSWESQIENIVVDSATVTSAASPIVRTYKPTEPGFYYIEASGYDSRKNLVLSDAYFYVSGTRYVAWERSNDDRIELIANRTNYKPGEIASIIVKSPYEGATALVSLEREGIISHFTTRLVGSAPQIDIPILREHLPNVFVSVVLLQGRVEAAAITKESDVGRPSFKMGYINLSVSPTMKLMSVSVETDKKSYRPGDSVEVTIIAKNAAGSGVSAEVALSVADLGILNLINYRMPNVFHYFYRQRGLAVITAETRIHLIQQRNYDEKGEESGGGGGEEAASMTDAEGIRKDFRPSAYWNPNILTDANGKASIRFKLPDNLTSFETMAVAQTLESDFGYGESSFQVNKPLLLQPSLPRFARMGDVFEGGVVVMNYSESEKRVRLITKTTGLQYQGTDTGFVVLKPGESKEVRTKMLADKVGTAELTFRANSDTDYDGLFWKIPIQVPRVRESVATSESTVDREKRERIQIPKEVFKDLGNIQCTLASTAMVGLSGGISYLFEYPYGCLEQRLSRVLPMIMAKDLVDAFKFEVLKDKDYREVVTKMIDEVPLFQRGDGGFTYWKNTDDTWPYLSAFTMYTLVQAERQGYSIDKTAKERGFNYLRDVLNGKVLFQWYGEAAWSCTRALALYTLALSGKPEFGYMEKLYSERAKIGLFAKAYLLKALVAAKGNRAMVNELVRDLTNNAKVAPTSAHFEEREASEWYWIFHSNARTTALILQAMVETQPENSLIPKVVRWLLDQQKTGCWRTTQENLYVIDALATYFKVYEKDEPNFTAEVRIAGGEFMKEVFKGRSLKSSLKEMPMSDLQRGADYPLDFLKDGPGRLYYTVRMNYFPTTETKAKDEGIAVSKNTERLVEVPGSAWTIASGAVSKITLTISTNQERNFIVVDDPVPAGFEIINTSFETSGSNLLEEEQNKAEWWTWNPFRHREMYDDRALFFADYLPAGSYTLTYLVRVTSYGTFLAPATRAEGMYEPEVFGQTSSNVIRVQ